MDTAYDVAVIGNGMIGSAATKYLSASGLRVTGIGPSEPADRKSHTGVFASHYDQGRITRIIDPDPLWSRLGARSIAAYQEIEAQTGVSFHDAVGCLRVSPYYQQPNDSLAEAARNGELYGADFQVVERDMALNLFPMLSLDESAVGLWEQGGAGYVNPRNLVQAQLQLAVQNGAAIFSETVVKLEMQDEVVRLTTDAGHEYGAHKVLIAAGAYTNHLLDRDLDLHPTARTVLMARLGVNETERLAGMPSIIYRLPPNGTLYSIYALPPIQYPDGYYYLKIGGTTWTTPYIYEHQELVDWFHADGRQEESTAIREVLHELVPRLEVEQYATAPCFTTYTAHGYPYIDVVDSDSYDTGRVFVCAGGNGAAAKSSNEIGRIGALVVTQGAWTYDIDGATFRALYADERPVDAALPGVPQQTQMGH